MVCLVLQAKLPLNCLQISADLTQKVYILDSMRLFFAVKALVPCLITFSLIFCAHGLPQVPVGTSWAW